MSKPSDHAAALLPIARFDAPAAWHAIDIVSDLHLAADHPATFDAWRRHLIETPADAVLLLGDVFEVWVGDDAAAEGFERRCADVLREAADRRLVAFMCGNRDFLVGDDFLADCGVRRLDDPTLLAAWGRCWLLTHGDALCLSDVAYQRFRAQSRDPAWQAAVLARPIAERRTLAQTLRGESEATKSRQAPGDWTDVDPPAAVEWLRAARCTELIHGHTHRPGSEALAPGYTRHVLSDWDHDVVPRRGEVLRITAHGLARLAPEAALARC